MSDLTVQTLLETPTVTVHDIQCNESCRHRSAEECASATNIVFPYQGAFIRHLGRDEAVAQPTQVLFFNPGEGYRVSHPVNGGDACVNVVLDDELLRELAPKALLRDQPNLAFRKQLLSIDARAQALVVMLRQKLSRGAVEPLEAESLALNLIRRTLGPRTSRVKEPSEGRQRLVNRAKVVLASDLSRRWTLSDIAAEVGGSPVYLTQVFQQVEGVPLYRYQLGLRLARALDLVAAYDDLTTLSLELGFSSHSHFSAAFQRTYGRSPSAFRQSGAASH